jgi:transposase-like protein
VDDTKREVTTMEGLKCPKCDGNRLEKYGRTKAGHQKLRCLETTCGRQFVVGSSHLIAPETKALVERLLLAKIPPPHIKKAVPGISLRWIYELRRRMQ